MKLAATVAGTRGKFFESSAVQASYGSWYLLRFILGGGVIVGMTWLAEHLHPKYAAYLYVVPVQLTIAVLFTYLGTSEKTVRDLLISTFASLGVLAAFSISFYLSMSRFSFWQSLGVSYGVFGISTAVYFSVL